MALNKDEISAAIQAVKSQMPDAWEKMKQNEALGRGHDNIDTSVDALLNQTAKAHGHADTVTLFMELRRAIRRELGLPT